MASTRTLAVVVGSSAAAMTFAVVSIVGSASPRPDLGGPVVVETGTGEQAPGATGDDGSGDAN